MHGAGEVWLLFLADNHPGSFAGATKGEVEIPVGGLDMHAAALGYNS